MMTSPVDDNMKGDVAKSIQELVHSQFVSKKFKDIMGSTRLMRSEILVFSILEINRMVALILSLSEDDVSEKKLEKMDATNKAELQEMWTLNRRFLRNPHALVHAVHEAFEYMYGLGLQSLDGLSRSEGVTLAGGQFRRILDPNDMGFFQKARRRLMGDVLFTEG